MEDESAPPQMAAEAMPMEGMDAPDAMPVKSVEEAMGETGDHEKVMDSYDESVSNGNGTNVHSMGDGMDTGMDTSEQVTESAPEEPKDSFDQMVTEEKKPEEKKSSSLFDSILNKAWTAKKEEPEPEPASEDAVEDQSEDKASEDTEDKEESEDKEKEENEDGDKDTFDNMLSGESTADAETAKKEDDGETKTDTPPATTISEDALEEMEKDEIITISSEKVPDDDKYYEDLKTEEKEWLEANMPTVDSIYGKVTCCICAKHVEAVIGLKSGGIQRHPHLGVPTCMPCRKFYGDGDWPRTEDGDEYCRMCAQGGDILLCDKCPNAFCKKCITRNLGSKALREITKSEEWSCLLCDPAPIYSLKGVYYCVYKCQTEIKERREQDKIKEKERKKKTSLAKEKEALVKSPQNFLEENISEAFKTLEVYQKSLEAERVRCIKTVKEGISVDVATSITRKLRKLYAVTQKNMDLLDRAIVESFVENYPTESTRIHMGRMAPTDPPSPPKRPRAAHNKKKKKPAQKIKIKAKKPVKGKKNVIKMNGAPVYAEYSGAKKRKTVYKDSDDDVIALSDDEYYAPKKKSRPGPASKKGKPGPASKTKRF